MTLSKAFNKHSTEWRELKGLLIERKAELVTRLVSTNTEEPRGRIKEIDEVLSLDKKDDQTILQPGPMNY
jgi:hypothetical protein